MVDSKAKDAAIERAYAQMSKNEKAEIKALGKPLLRIRGVGEKSACEILGKVGMFIEDELAHERRRKRL